MYHTNINQKKTGVAILISGKADFKTRKSIQGLKKALGYDKVINSPGRHNNP